MNIITRKIEIDAGHRLPSHKSKCRNLHGHRYVIEAACSGPLATEGSDQGMVLDFGFLKEEMMLVIDQPCDHGFMLWVGDDELMSMFFPNGDVDEIVETVKNDGAWSGSSETGMKLYVMSTVPTAENLAKHWYDIMDKRISDSSNGKAKLKTIKVWETPNCTAQYPMD